MLLVIDNYDSFVHNLERYLRRLGQETLVVRNDAVAPDCIDRLRPAAIVLSPGPCAPEQAGCGLDLVRRYHQRVPILGICLGHQTIAAALGGRITCAKRPLHGQASWIRHDGQGVFAEAPNPLNVGRYHSLIVAEDSLPPVLQATAWSDEGEIMAVRHREAPVIGLQFHPESILTDHGYRLLGAFLKLAGIDYRMPLDAELRTPPPPSPPCEGSTPVTF